MNPVITIEAEEAQYKLKSIGQREVKEQIAYCDLGGKHPVQIKFNLPENMDRAYPVGEYTPSIESFRVGKYGNLELNPFELKLERLVTPKSESKAS